MCLDSLTGIMRFGSCGVLFALFGLLCFASGCFSEADLGSRLFAAVLGSVVLERAFTHFVLVETIESGIFSAV